MKKINYGSRALAIIRSANISITTASIHLLTYKEDAWCFTAFRHGAEDIHESNSAGDFMKPQNAFIVDRIYDEIKKSSGGSAASMFFLAENLFIDRIWAFLTPLGLRTSEIVVHGYDLRAVSFINGTKKK